MVEEKNANLSTLSVTIQALHVSGKQMTLAVFKQLPWVHLTPPLTPWGFVRYEIKGEADLWLVFSHGGILYRASKPHANGQENAARDANYALRDALAKVANIEAEITRTTARYQEERQEAIEWRASIRRGDPLSSLGSTVNLWGRITRLEEDEAGGVTEHRSLPKLRLSLEEAKAAVEPARRGKEEADRELTKAMVPVAKWDEWKASLPQLFIAV